MKKYILFAIAAVLLSIVSCEKWNADVEEPEVAISISPANPKVGDTVTVKINSKAQYLSIFTGDKGHDFENSEVKYTMLYGDAALKDSVYSKRISCDGSVWKRNMGDYKSLEDLKKEFEFFGAIENIQLGDFEKPSISQVNMSQKRMLKFTITDRNTISGLIFHPDVHLYNWDIFYEIRLVPCQEDSVARFVGRKNQTIYALWNTTLKNVSNGEETVCSGDMFKESGPWCWDYYFYVYPTYEPCLPPRNEGSFCEFYSVRSRIKSQNEYAYTHPEEYVASELKMGFGSSYQPWYTEPGYELDEKGFPSNLNNYQGFQGDVYITTIQWGQDVYEDYDLGVSLGSEFTGLDMTKEYSYVYEEAGDYDIVVVGTNIGRKQYSGDGYQTERSSYDSEYIKYRTVAKAKISVSE